MTEKELDDERERGFWITRHILFYTTCATCCPEGGETDLKIRANILRTKTVNNQQSSESIEVRHVRHKITNINSTHLKIVEFKLNCITNTAKNYVVSPTFTDKCKSPAHSSFQP